MRCLLGIDDTDSRFGHCTTHLGFRIVGDLLDLGCVFRRYPRLVRLNPNVPFKTRGNAAVCLDFEAGDPQVALDAAELRFREFSDVENGANSGLVFWAGPSQPDLFRGIYLSAISGLVSYRRVLKLLSEKSVPHLALGNGMGVVGAAASLGFDPSDDHTYELIAYRDEGALGTPRRIGDRSVREMERSTFPHTFNSYDHGKRRILIAPHGPDPVFLGLRADSPEVAFSAFRTLEFDEVLAGHMIYITNQCTDAHLGSRLSMPLKAYSSGWLEGVVQRVERGDGGHLYISLDEGGEAVRCAVYRPSADLKRQAAMLRPHDEVRVFGGVRRGTKKHPPVLNIEKIEVLKVDEVARRSGPVCGRCGVRAKSEGRDKGFQCRRCGAKFASSEGLVQPRERSIVAGVYLPSPGSQRHLTKPLIRYGSERSSPHPLIPGWYSTVMSSGTRSPRPPAGWAPQAVR